MLYTVLINPVALFMRFQRNWMKKIELKGLNDKAAVVGTFIRMKIC